MLPGRPKALAIGAQSASRVGRGAIAVWAAASGAPGRAAAAATAPPRAGAASAAGPSSAADLSICRRRSPLVCASSSNLMAVTSGVGHRG